MPESTSKELSNEDTDSASDQVSEDSDATSKETLSDIEDNEGSVGSGSSGSDPGPSPDGALDESDEIKDAGPM